MKEFERKIKDDEQITINLIKKPGISNLYHEFHAFDADKVMIGYLGFELIKMQGLSSLRSIAVDPKYLGRGVGSSMHDLYEQYMLQNNCKYIEGVYYPYGEGAELTPLFYQKHGYQFFREGRFLIGLSKIVTKNDYNVPQFIEYEEEAGFTNAPWEKFSSMEK